MNDQFKSLDAGESANFEKQMILMQQCRQVTRSRHEKLTEIKSGLGGNSDLSNALQLSSLDYHPGKDSEDNANHQGGDTFVVTR